MRRYLVGTLTAFLEGSARIVKTKQASTKMRTSLVITRFSCRNRPLSISGMTRGLGHLLPRSVSICGIYQMGPSTRTEFSTATHACGCCVAAMGFPFGHRCQCQVRGPLSFRGVGRTTLALFRCSSFADFDGLRASMGAGVYGVVRIR